MCVKLAPQRKTIQKNMQNLVLLLFSDVFKPNILVLLPAVVLDLLPFVLINRNFA